jgi:hypothetical protein
MEIFHLMLICIDVRHHSDEPVRVLVELLPKDKETRIRKGNNRTDCPRSGH